MADIEAQCTTLLIARTKSPLFILKECSAETRGNTGKSSWESVLIDAWARSVSILNNSPAIAAETVFPRVLLKKPLSTDAGTAAIPSDETFAGITTSTPHSRLVARKIILFPSTTNNTQPKTGKLVFFSVNLDVMEVASSSVLSVVSNFITFLYKIITIIRDVDWWYKLF